MPDNVTYHDKHVQISETQVVIGQQIFNNDEITGVSVERVSMSPQQRIGYAIASFLLMAIGFALADVSPCMLLLGIFGLIGIPASFFGKQFALKVKTASGETLTLKSTNQKVVLQARDALNEYVVAPRTQLPETLDSKPVTMPEPEADDSTITTIQAAQRSIKPSTTSPWLAQDNLGTRYQDAAHARTVWLASHLTTYTPVVIYHFPTLDAAHQAITQLSFIHEAADTGDLIATEVVEFGCFVNEDGQGEVMICGKGFTLNRWQEAMDKLAAAGGILHREQKPEAQPSATITPAAPEERPAVLAAPAAPTKTDSVTFVSEDHKGMHTYRVHRAPSKAAAIAFLQANPVTQNYLYLIVETPEGDFGRDINGIYEE